MYLLAGPVISIIRKLGTLLQQEYNLHKGLPKEIENLKIELESAHTALLKVGEVPPEQLDPQVQLWARDVREASYDMEDILDTFLVNVVDQVAAPAEKKYGMRKRLREKMAMLFKKSKARHKIAGAIEEMKKRLHEVADRRERYSIEVSPPAPVTRVDPRLVDMEKEVAQLVGINEKKAKLIAMLLPSSHSHRDADVSSSSSSDRMKIVSVVGVGGLGKTTLAKAVYDQLKPEYKRGAFVSVGRKPDLVQVLTSIFFFVDKTQYEKIRGVKDLQLLIGELRNFLQEKRYFIVIDDVWDIDSWKTIKSALGHKNSGSRVIITTRNREVAIDEEVYHLPALSCPDSKKLFDMRLHGGEDKCPTNYPDDESKKILHKCSGVPLAIITMASLLVGKSIEDWYEVCKSPGFDRGKDNKQVEDTVWILSLSYYDLPLHLKACLLYLSVYPEDYLIDKKSLIWKWIAEGFIQKKKETIFFEQGEKYFNQLINRNLIEVAKSGKESIYSYRIHDMVLDLIRDLADKENFVTVSKNDNSTTSKSKVRRLTHQNRMMNRAHQGNHMDLTRLRSFLAYRCNIHGWDLDPSFKLLRVLALESSTPSYTEGWYGLKHIGNLIHLRYLGLRSDQIKKLPDEVGALKLLQTLDLKDSSIQELPTTVGMLTQLVWLRGGSRTSLSMDGFLGKVKLLEELEICHCYTYNDEYKRQFVKQLSKLAELRVLVVHSIVGESSPSFRSDILQSGNFNKLCLWDKDRLASGEWDTAVLSRYLRHLVIEDIWFPCLPSCINPTHLRNLSHLALCVYHMDNTGLRALGGLPELLYLRLEACLWMPMGYRKAMVATIVSTDGLFLKLRCCKLDGWMVQLALCEDSTTVSFSISNGLGASAMAFGSRTKEQTSSRVEPAAVVMMPNLRDLKFRVLVRALYGDGRTGSCENLGLEYLGSLSKIRVIIDSDFGWAFADDVDKAEAELSQAAKLHPNRPILKIRLENGLEIVRQSTPRRRREEEEGEVPTVADDLFACNCGSVQPTGKAHDKTTESPSRLQKREVVWIMEPGVRMHQTSNLHLLRDLHNVDDTMPVLCRGTVQSEKFTIQEVSYVPEAKCNIISIGQLCSQYGLEVMLESKGLHIMDPKTKKTVGRAHLCDNGSYVLDYLLINHLKVRCQNRICKNHLNPRPRHRSCVSNTTGDSIFGGNLCWRGLHRCA